MDRDIPSDERRRLRLRRALPWAVGLAAVAVLLVLLPGWIRPSVDRDRLRIGVADEGPVEDALQASGTVVPAFEKTLVSPVEARVLRILRRPGDGVEAGDPLVELDLSAARLEHERAEERLDRKRTEAHSARRDLERQEQRRLAAVREAELEVEMAAYRLEQQRSLHEEGLTPESPLREAEVAHRKAGLSLEQARRDLAAARDERDATLASLAREIELLEKERAETRRRLELGTARSDRSGVVTWVLPREGVMVGRGEELARIADLSSFGVEGRIASLNADRLEPGLPVRIEIDGDTRLEGTIGTVDPTIEEGTARFRVLLSRPSHRRLRNNQRVDAWVIADRRAHVVRVPKGPFATAGGGSILVVEGDRLVRRDVTLGLTGVDHYEVEDGLAPGERVVLSNLEEYDHLTEIRLE